MWLAPAESLPAVTSYELIICEDAACDDADDNVSPTRRETVILQNSAKWAGPEAGHYVARFNSQDLVPGQSLTFKVRACNDYLDICGAENVAEDCLRCGYYSNLLSLATVPAVPGESAAPTVEAINQTNITVGVGVAAYGECVLDLTNNCVCSSNFAAAGACVATNTTDGQYSTDERCQVTFI